MEALVGAFSFPPGPILNADKLEPPLLATKIQFPSDVTPAEVGFEPVEVAAVESAVKAPVAGLYLYCETRFAFSSTA